MVSFVSQVHAVGAVRLGLQAQQRCSAWVSRSNNSLPIGFGRLPADPDGHLRHWKFSQVRDDKARQFGENSGGTRSRDKLSGHYAECARDYDQEFWWKPEA